MLTGDCFRRDKTKGMITAKNNVDIKGNEASEIPKHVYESLARTLLPAIQEYFESDAGKQAFAEWKAKQAIPPDNKVN